MDSISQPISEFAHSLKFDDIPAEVVHAAKQRLIDSLGCGLGGLHCPAAIMAMELSDGARPARHAGRILGTRQYTTADMATFINCSMIRYLDFNDAWPDAGHPSDCIGGLLAMAEAAGADGRQFLTAMITAYEVTLRLGPAAKIQQRGWDQGQATAVGMAAGIGNLLGLPVDRIAEAVSICAIAEVPLRATRAGKLSLWKGVATPYAARNGVFNALLAAQGMTGPDRPFEGKHAVWEQISGRFDLPPFGTRTEDFRGRQTRFKFWPVEYAALIAVSAARDIRARLPLERIARIEIGTYHMALHEIGSGAERWDPRNRETADHSLPYIFARVLVDGTIGLNAFEESAYLDPSMRPVMAKISVHEDDRINALYPDTVAMRVVVSGTAGENFVLNLENPRGHEKNPMTDQEIDEKFTGLATPVLGAEGAAAALSAWRQVDRAPTLGAALDLLVPANARR